MKRKFNSKLSRSEDHMLDRIRNKRKKSERKNSCQQSILSIQRAELAGHKISRMRITYLCSISA
jgi:hypothetical protein